MYFCYDDGDTDHDGLGNDDEDQEDHEDDDEYNDNDEKEDVLMLWQSATELWMGQNILHMGLA